MADGYQSGILVEVAATAITGGRDQIFEFTPLKSTRVRVIAAAASSGLEPRCSPCSTIRRHYHCRDRLNDVRCHDRDSFRTTMLAYSYDAASTPASLVRFVRPRAMRTTRKPTASAPAWATWRASTRLGRAGVRVQQEHPLSTTLAIDVSHRRDRQRRHDLCVGAMAPRLATPTGRAASWTKWPRSNIARTSRQTGTWQDGKCSSSGAFLTDNTFYVCEDATPTVAPNEDAATALVIPQASTRVVTGKTGTPHEQRLLSGATLLSACNA